MDVVGTKIKWIRGSTGQSQSEFAEGVGVSSRAIGTWESSNNFPYISNLKLLAKYIDIPVCELSAFLKGKKPLSTIPLHMRTWLIKPITKRLSKKTLSDLKMLLQEAGALP